jgi:CheY-like chemotaxis protein
MADFHSFLEANQRLENEMSDRQNRLMNILTGHHGYESSSEGDEAKELLENEIENRKNAIEKLERQSYCDFCKTQLDLDDRCRISISKYSEKLPNKKLMIEKVLVTMECANCHHDHDSRPRPERMVATKDEIDRAIEMLTPAQWQQLKSFAAWRVRGLGRAGLGRTGDDLFQEAWVSTFTGAEGTGEGRCWNKNGVDFFGHLRGAIRGISFGWKQKFNEWEPFLEADITTRNVEGDEIAPLENVPANDPSADQCLSVKEEIERRFKIFANDKEATAVFEGRLDGMIMASEIMQEYNLTKRHYQAAAERIRCPKSVLVIEDYDQVLALVVRWLKLMGYAVHTACNSVEGLRLCRECGPFDVVMISYSPKLNKLNGVELATDILKKNPSQRMIITTTHSSEEDVVRPSELMHIPILLKPFGKSELRTALPKSANTLLEKPNCSRHRRCKTRAPRLRVPFPTRKLAKK